VGKHPTTIDIEFGALHATTMHIIDKCKWWFYALLTKENENKGNDGWSLKCVTNVCLISMKFRYMINKGLNFNNVILKLWRFSLVKYFNDQTCLRFQSGWVFIRSQTTNGPYIWIQYWCAEHVNDINTTVYHFKTIVFNLLLIKLTCLWSLCMIMSRTD